jgi:hypothetical protein
MGRRADCGSFHALIRDVLLEGSFMSSCWMRAGGKGGGLFMRL